MLLSVEAFYVPWLRNVLVCGVCVLGTCGGSGYTDLDHRSPPHLFDGSRFLLRLSACRGETEKELRSTGRTCLSLVNMLTSLGLRYWLRDPERFSKLSELPGVQVSDFRASVGRMPSSRSSTIFCLAARTTWTCEGGHIRCAAV